MTSLPAIRVTQWLNTWNNFPFDSTQRQRRPKPYYFITSMSATLLRRLSHVRRRTTTGPRYFDTGIQRGHDKERSDEIRRFVDAGYPWATLNAKQQTLFDDLKKPGWLPTALVGNIISPTSPRSMPIDQSLLIQIADRGDQMVDLILPPGSDNPDWQVPENTSPPIEIIDGQHRLYAFKESENIDGTFELPIVLFYDLDISWQAYLFWTINIRPKRINPSMAYDLYPLLRTDRWLERVEGPMAYRETRAQELTEALWSHPDSPWHQRIGMLGRERGKVTQAAFVRSLVLSFVRGWAKNRQTGIGGFFGTELTEDRSEVLRWTRAQQAAFLIVLWMHMEDAIRSSDHDWAVMLRDRTKPDDVPPERDAAFAGRYSLLATDQGVRGFLQVANDLSYSSRHTIDFNSWTHETVSEHPTSQEITECISELRLFDEIDDLLRHLGHAMASFDWRSAVTPGLPADVETFQSRYRSGSGYKQVRLQLLRHLSGARDSYLKEAAREIARALKYNID